MYGISNGMKTYDIMMTFECHRSRSYSKKFEVKHLNPATTVFFFNTLRTVGVDFYPMLNTRIQLLFYVKIDISGWSLFYLSISEKGGNSPQGLLTWRHDVTMTLFDVKSLSYKKIDVFCDISSCRLHTSPISQIFWIGLCWQIKQDVFQYYLFIILKMAANMAAKL